MAVARDDIRITMPPQPYLFEEIDQVGPLMLRAFDEGAMGEWRLVPTRANFMPVANGGDRPYIQLIG